MRLLFTANPVDRQRKKWLRKQTMGDIEKAILELVNKKVDEILENKGLALRFLKDFESVDFLTFDETRAVYRLSEDEMINAIKTGKIAARKLGKSPDTWRFSKRLIFESLFEREEKTKPEKKTFSGSDEFERMALKLLG